MLRPFFLNVWNVFERFGCFWRRILTLGYRCMWVRMQRTMVRWEKCGGNCFDAGNYWFRFTVENWLLIFNKGFSSTCWRADASSYRYVMRRHIDASKRLRLDTSTSRRLDALTRRRFDTKRRLRSPRLKDPFSGKVNQCWQGWYNISSKSARSWYEILTDQ